MQDVISYMIHIVPKKNHFFKGKNMLLGLKSVIHFLYEHIVNIFNSSISLNVIAAVID